MATDVTGLITQSRTDASALIQTGNNFLDTVMGLTKFDVTVDPAVSIADVIAVGQAAANNARTAIDTVLRSSVARPIIPTISSVSPERPILDAIPTITPQVIPDFTSIPPVLDFPVLPAVALPASPGAAPTFKDPVIPDSPVIVLPNLPTFTDVAIPDAPSISVEMFTKTLPLNTLLAPTAQFAWAENAYASTLLDGVKAKLLDDMVNGTYGIDVNDEIRLYERARSRINITADAAAEDLINTHVARGWPKPTGALNSDLIRGRQALLEQHAGINSDVMVKRADLFNETRKFTIQQVIALETITISYFGAVQERALNAAKANIEMAVVIFDAQVKQYNLYIEQFKAEVTAYGERIKAGLAQAEIYRYQILAVEAKVGIQKNQVELYRAQLAGIESVVNVYRTRMEAANIAAQVERTRLDAFRSTIEAYVAQVQAKVSEFGLYESKIKAETARVSAYEVEVKAYASRVDAAKTKATMDIEVLRSVVAKNDSLIAVYNADISKFRALLEQNIANINALEHQYGIDVQLFLGELQALLKTFDIADNGSRLYFDSVKLDMADKLDRARIAYQQLLESARIRTGTAEFGSTFLGNQITGTLNSINTLAASVQST